MANIAELTERLLRRFGDVPNVTVIDVEEWVESALNEHGYTRTDNVPTDVTSLVMLYAQADGATEIALRTAHYFSFVDKDESLDKSMISEEYRKLSEVLWKRYRRMKEDGVGGIGGSSFHIMKRYDRIRPNRRYRL